MYYGSSCGCSGNQGYPNYGYSYPYVMYPGYQCCNNNSNNAIVIVLFILLVIIIGCRWGR